MDDSVIGHKRPFWIGASWPFMRENGAAWMGYNLIEWGDGTYSTMYHFGRVILWIGTRTKGVTYLARRSN